MTKQDLDQRTTVRPRAVLALEDGTVFEGRSFGREGEVTGEGVFNTALCGYQEGPTDPSHAGAPPPHRRTEGARGGVVSAVDYAHASLVEKARSSRSMIGLDLAREVT